MALTKLQELEHDTTGNTGNSMVKIDATHYILAYEEPNASVIHVKTFVINGS